MGALKLKAVRLIDYGKERAGKEGRGLERNGLVFNMEEKESSDESLTLRELIKILNEYPKEMKVVFTWESIFNPIKKKFIYKSKNGNLILDADWGSYKHVFASDKEENEGQKHQDLC